MAIEVGDIITISYVERCNGTVFATNIEEVAKDNDLYEEERTYAPIIICVGRDHLAKGLQDEFIGKDVGAKGTVFVPAEKAYGERSKDKVHSIDKKEFEKGTSVGDSVRHPEYGNGLIVNKVGPRFIVDFNDGLAGRDIEYDYEIHESVTDPAEQLSRMLHRMVNGEFDVSFEDGKGIVSLNVPLMNMEQWNKMKFGLVWELLAKLPSLDSLVFHEEYENLFNLKPVIPGDESESPESESSESESESSESDSPAPDLTPAQDE